MERFTNGVSLPRHLLAPTTGLDRVGRVPESLGAPAATPEWTGQDLLGRGPGRWHVRPGKKGGACVGKTKRGKGTKIMLLIDGRGMPLAADVHSASPAEVTLIEPLLKRQLLRRRVRRVIYDRAADSDQLRRRLACRGVQLICPHRSNRVRRATQDGRSLRRYKRRWKVERSISWLFNFRRLTVRYERYAHLFRGLLQLACAFVILRRF
jgi:transposase